MTINQLLSMPTGSRTGSFYLTVKTAKKKWQVGDVWYHQVLLVDETGEMLADVCIGKYNPLIAGQRPWIIVCEVQEAEIDHTKASRTGKKLLVSEFRHDTVTEPPEMGMLSGEGEKVIRSKILCWLTAAKIETGESAAGVRAYIKSPILKEIVDFIIEGGNEKAP